MTIETPELTYHAPPGFDDRAEYEMEMKGHLCGGGVEFPDGRRYPVTFFDPVRLSQELEVLTGRGEPAFIEPGLVVIPGVTRDGIRRSLPELVRQRFFDHLRPLGAEVPANGVSH
ncbi:MAG: hypothetical protein K2X82_00175 [Gemmataceae bacterium]|nr:hypothetical protein [Gemmataceae bacterium]